MNRYYDLGRLNSLFEKLKLAKLQSEFEQIESSIWQVWMDAQSDIMNHKMLEGTDYMAQQEYCEAIATFTEMTERWETYSEAWNKRATVYYLKGEYKKSLEDISKTLTIEPRHFGALSGRATIYRELCYDRGVMDTLCLMQALMPGKNALDKQIKEVQSRLGPFGK